MSSIPTSRPRKKRTSEGTTTKKSKAPAAAASGKPRRSNRKEKPQDHFRQLYNKCAVGPITKVQLPLERITKLHGIMLDVDLGLIRPQSVAKGCLDSPAKFYEQIVKDWLKRDPVLSKAGVRNSGGGLHILLHFKAPVVFSDDSDRQRWAGIVEVIQSSLPTDPDAPGITAVTRAPGSINGKWEREVTRLKRAQPAEEAEVLDLFDRMCQKPFRTLTNILFGNNDVTPCPICNGERTKLSALDYVGRCYGSCGQVKLDQLYDHFLEPRPNKAASQ